MKQEHVTRALERLRKNYQKNNHLEAQVSLTERQYQADTNQVNYLFKVDEGPTVEITTEGAKISKGELKKLVPVYQENSVDDDLLNEGRRNLRDYLQIKGYFDATVEVERHPSRRRTTSTSFTSSTRATSISCRPSRWKATATSIPKPLPSA